MKKLKTEGKQKKKCMKPMHEEPPNNIHSMKLFNLVTMIVWNGRLKKGKSFTRSEPYVKYVPWTALTAERM